MLSFALYEMERDSLRLFKRSFWITWRATETCCKN